jgi:prepilin-type N-terminal cleavage/methylation domain-containing protein
VHIIGVPFFTQHTVECTPVIKAAERFPVNRNMSTSRNHGFTLIELLVVVAILGILASIAMASYHQYLDRAKRTVSISALENMRKLIEGYAIDHGNYPATIDFSTCIDQNSVQVFPPLICSQMHNDLFSIDSYTLSGSTYTVMSRALDRSHSILMMTGDSIVIVTP